MLCILKLDTSSCGDRGGNITGWIIASDIDDACRQADGAGERDLAAALYRMGIAPPAGKHVLPTGHVLLVA